MKNCFYDDYCLSVNPMSAFGHHWLHTKQALELYWKQLISTNPNLDLELRFADQEWKNELLIFYNLTKS